MSAERELALEATLVDDSGLRGRDDPLLATMTMMHEDGDLIVAGGASSNVAAFTRGYLLAGRYRIQKRIGKGGFGFVYAAADLELSVKVAIKVLRPEVDGNRAMVRRFKQEIQLARQVTHQNVCRIYDVGFYEFGDLRVPFLSMELLDGESLAERLKRKGTLSLKELRPIALQVASGLEAAHRVGIVHADLKPANIMLVGEGVDTRAVITDSLGLASAHAAEVESTSDAIVGTPAYMAPEQVRGDSLTPATDFYALGCTLFQAISGKLPFVEDSVLATAEARLSGRIPRLRSASGRDAAVWSGLVRDLMTMAPKKRLADARVMRHRLRSRTSRRIAIAAIGLSLILGGILAYVLLSRPSPTPEPPVFSLSLPELGEARERYEKGLREWEVFDSSAALRTWQKAVAEGYGHPMIRSRICSALSFLDRAREVADCWKAAFEASHVVSEEERRFYRAEALRYSQNPAESIGILLELLREYPGSFELSRSLAGVQRQLREYESARNTMERVRPATTYERISATTLILHLLTEEKNYQAVVDRAPGFLDEVNRLGFARMELQVLFAVALSHRNLGNFESSREMSERSLALAIEIGSKHEEAEAVGQLSAVAMQTQRFGDAEALIARNTKLYGALGKETEANQLLITQSEVMKATGRVKQADALLTNRALPLLRQKDNTYWEGYALLKRADVRLTLGRVNEAIEDCYAGEAIFRAIGSKRLQAFAKMICGRALIAAGNLAAAERELGEAIKTRRELGLEFLVLQNELLAGELWNARGNPAKAYAIALGVCEKYRNMGHGWAEMEARELVARAALNAGNLQNARDALDAIGNVPRGENAELNLQIDILENRLAFRTDPKAATIAALDSLIASAEEQGYVYMARVARRDTTLDIASTSK